MARKKSRKGKKPQLSRSKQLKLLTVHFGSNVKAQRLAKGWTQAELAQRMGRGYSRQCVCRYERQARTPGLLTMSAITKAFGCTAMSLLAEPADI